MADYVLMDNDIALKACCYDVVDHVIACVAGTTRTLSVLGVVRFVLRGVIARGHNISNQDRATNRLAHLLAHTELIEPNKDELALAAKFEETAQSLGVDLDIGESQLLAVLIQRSASLLLTGDKRAVRAIGPVVNAHGYSEKLERRVACLEQLAMALIVRYGAEPIHTLVCAEEAIDKTLAICFACASGNRQADSITRALASYIGDLRRNAHSVLVDSDNLSTVVSQEDGVG